MKDVKCIDCAYVCNISDPINDDAWDGHRRCACLSFSPERALAYCADCFRKCEAFRGRDNNELKDDENERS